MMSLVVILSVVGTCLGQLGPPPGRVMPIHLLSDPQGVAHPFSENPFALDGMCWSLDKQLRAIMGPTSSPKEPMADKVQSAIIGFLNGGGEIPSSGGGNVACVIRNAKKGAGKKPISNNDLATAVSEKVAESGCRIPCFDAATAMWAQPPPGMAPPSPTPALNIPPVPGTFDPMGHGGMGPMVDPYNQGFGGGRGFDPMTRGPGQFDPGMSNGRRDTRMRRQGSFDTGMRGSSQGTSNIPYDPMNGGVYDSAMGNNGPYDPAMGGQPVYDPTVEGGQGRQGQFDRTMRRRGQFESGMGRHTRFDSGRRPSGNFGTGGSRQNQFNSGMGRRSQVDSGMTRTPPRDSGMGGSRFQDTNVRGQGSSRSDMGTRFNSMRRESPMNMRRMTMRSRDTSMRGQRSGFDGRGSFGHGMSNQNERYPNTGGMGRDRYPRDGPGGSFPGSLPTMGMNQPSSNRHISQRRNMETRKQTSSFGMGRQSGTNMRSSPRMATDVIANQAPFRPLPPLSSPQAHQHSGMRINAPAITSNPLPPRSPPTETAMASRMKTAVSPQNALKSAPNAAPLQPGSSQGSQLPQAPEVSASTMPQDASVPSSPPKTDLSAQTNNRNNMPGSQQNLNQDLGNSLSKGIANEGTGTIGISPQSGDMQTPSNFIPQAHDMMPHSSNMMPHQSNTMAHSSNMMPQSSDMMPHSSDMMSQPSNMMPPPSNMMPHSSNMMPHSSSMMPHQSNTMAHSSNMMPQSIDMMSHSSDMMSQPSNMMPPPSNMMPPPSNMMPHSSNMMPQSSKMMPQSSNMMPQSSNMMPQSSDMMPQSSNMMPQSSDMMPQPSNMMPQSSNMMPQPSNMMPQSGNIMPHFSDVMPKSRNMMPGLQNMMPQESRGMFSQDAGRRMSTPDSSMFRPQRQTGPGNGLNDISQGTSWAMRNHVHSRGLGGGVSSFSNAGNRNSPFMRNRISHDPHSSSVGANKRFHSHESQFRRQSFVSAAAGSPEQTFSKRPPINAINERHANFEFTDPSMIGSSKQGQNLMSGFENQFSMSNPSLGDSKVWSNHMQNLPGNNHMNSNDKFGNPSTPHVDTHGPSVLSGTGNNNNNGPYSHSQSTDVGAGSSGGPNIHESAAGQIYPTIPAGTQDTLNQISNPGNAGTMSNPDVGLNAAGSQGPVMTTMGPDPFMGPELGGPFDPMQGRGRGDPGALDPLHSGIMDMAAATDPFLGMGMGPIRDPLSMIGFGGPPVDPPLSRRVDMGPPYDSTGGLGMGLPYDPMQGQRISTFDPTNGMGPGQSGVGGMGGPYEPPHSGGMGMGPLPYDPPHHRGMGVDPIGHSNMGGMGGAMDFGPPSRPGLNPLLFL